MDSTPAATGQEVGRQDDDAILRELCAVNGVTFEKLPLGCGSKVERLEIFFFGYPRIVGLHHFPHLHSLCIVNQRFTLISGLDGCRCLKELWICETQIERIEGLHECRALTHLYLYSNQIASMKGLDSLTELTKLWLNGNRISTIEGLENLHQLVDLNLSGNVISSIDHSLDSLTRLEVLRLSGNRLSSLQELVQLSLLPRLHTLSLCEPAYPPNPVCQLCNYSTHTLYHLPHLQWLDDREVRVQQLQQVIQSVVANKKLYYRMRVHQAEVARVQECKDIEARKRAECQTALGHIRTLTRRFKALQAGTLQGERNGSDVDSLSKRLEELREYVGFVECCCRDACERARLRASGRSKQLCVELESGGNIKFIDGDPSLSWYKSCCNLVNSRYSVTESLREGVSITGIEVKAVTRVENRMLYNRFNEKVKLELDSISVASDSNSKHIFDYLFLEWNQSGQFCYVDVCKDGLLTDQLIPLSNSVNSADAARLKELSLRGDRGTLAKKTLAEMLRGTLLLCKVFVGGKLELTEDQLALHADRGGVYYCCSRGVSSPAQSHVERWFVGDGDLVLPEYVVEFSYLSQCKSMDDFDIMLLDRPSLPVIEGEELAPPTSSHPRLAMLDEATVLQMTSEASLATVKALGLHDNRLTRFRLSSSLSQISKLCLSFNELTTAKDFSHMPSLKVLDLSFNKLTSLHGLKNLPSLIDLDVSWNGLTSYPSDIAAVQRHAPSLSCLDARCNPWNKASGFRVHTLGRLQSLTKLDGVEVTTEEAAGASRVMTTSHISLNTLLHKASVSTDPSPSLSILPLAEQLDLLRKRGIVNPPSPQSATDWASKVTSVVLCGLGLSKLSCLDQLPSLKWLSLSDNNLSSFEGLALCSNLEELTIDSNVLESIDGVQHLKQLQWLSLSSNHLVSLPPLHTLSQLTYLNISDNYITSLAFLKSTSSLIELYASCNNLADTRQLFHLKPLIALSVVDLSHNPLNSTADYRQFALYHLSFIKALDGQSVGSSELASAKEKFGGRLSQDLINEKYPDVKFCLLRTLDFLHCNLKTVDLSPVDAFDNLASLNLEHNSLSSFSGLIYLNNLKVLCLNHNRIECMHHVKDRPPPNRVLQSLQVLHLAYNGITDLIPLQLGQLSSLRALFLQGNEIVHVQGLDGLESLTELVLDRNKIKNLNESSFVSQFNLRELHLEENRLKELSHLNSTLPSLERLYLGMNRLQEFSELEKLSGLTELIELSVVSNPVSRRLQHRSLLIYHLPSLLSLDGIMVTAEERHVAQMMFGCVRDTQEMDDVSCEVDMGAVVPTGTVGASHGHTPLKVLTVPFTQFGNSYHSQRKAPHSDTPYFQQLRKGRRT